MTSSTAIPKDEKAAVIPAAAGDAKKDEVVKTPSESNDKK